MKNNKIKTFEDLVFTIHPNSRFFDTQAKMNFENGYGISVITGDRAYSSELKPYEVAVMKDDCLCYDTTITDDVIGYCDANKVSEIMAKIQSL